jgi:3-oxoacyl-[acyl-carrier-protein] synthase-3
MVVSEKELVLQPCSQSLLRDLLLVWLDFERRLGKVPILRSLEQGTFTLDDYKTLLLNLRPQVIEGSRWISRAASSFTADFSELRSKAIDHASDEHRDYQMLERDYVSIGGQLEQIQKAQRNVGTEALASFLMQQASLPNPVDLLGAMFIIEGLGQKMAQGWAAKIQSCLKLGDNSTTFLRYHGVNDDTHLAKLHSILDSDAVDEQTAPRILKTAKVTARLYLLQLEEINNV